MNCLCNLSTFLKAASSSDSGCTVVMTVSEGGRNDVYYVVMELFAGM